MQFLFTSTQPICFGELDLPRKLAPTMLPDVTAIPCYTKKPV